MALPDFGPLSIADIATEFSDVAPHSLSEFYGVASGIPTVGNPISISDFYGTSSAPVLELFDFYGQTRKFSFNTETQSVVWGFPETSAGVKRFIIAAFGGMGGGTVFNTSIVGKTSTVYGQVSNFETFNEHLVYRVLEHDTEELLTFECNNNGFSFVSGIAIYLVYVSNYSSHSVGEATQIGATNYSLDPSGTLGGLNVVIASLVERNGYSSPSSLSWAGVSKDFAVDLLTDENHTGGSSTSDTTASITAGSSLSAASAIALRLY